MTTENNGSFNYHPNWDESNGCPEHGTKMKKRYVFGQWQDAEVIVFHGCQCAMCINSASFQCGVPTGFEITHHPSYAEASGRATLIKMQEAIDNKAFA